MYGRETRMLLKHYLDQGLSKSELSRRFGVSRRTVGRWIASGDLDRDFSAGERIYAPRPRPAHKLDPYREMISAVLADLPKLSGEAGFRRCPEGGIHRLLRAGAGLRKGGPAAPSGRSRGPFRDPAGAAGPGRFRLIQASLGPPPRPGGGPRPFPAAVVPVLSAPDDGASHRRAGERVRGLRRRPPRAAVRPDAGGRDLGRQRGRGRHHAQREVPALRGPLGLHAAGLQAVPGQDQGQGGAPDPLHPGRILLRPVPSPATAISTARPRPGWRARPTRASTAPPGSGPRSGSSGPERAALLPLAPCPFRSLGLPREAAPEPPPAAAGVTVEKRPLSVYAEVLQ